MASGLPIFVSHSHADNDFCEALVKALRDAGAAVWYDEHNLESGILMDEIMRELDHRKIFIVILSKDAIASKWVRRESRWAYELADQDPTRIILPVTAGPLERTDFSGANGWLFISEFKRIEANGRQPYPRDEAIRRTLHALALTPAGEAPAPIAPQAAETVEDIITRGKSLQQQGKHDEALALFLKATERDPNSFAAWFNIGYTYDRMGKYDEALAAYDRAISLNQRDAPAWNNKGAVLTRMKNYDAALEAFDRAIAIDDRFVLAWNNKGTVLMGKRYYAAALEAYDGALNIDSKQAATWNNRGSALSHLQRNGEALASYKQATELAPKMAFAWRNMAYTLRQLGHIKEAEEAEAKAKELGG